MATLDNHTAWFIEDHGNEDEIYQVDQKGKLLKVLKVKNAKNKDWEDLAKDTQNNIYIGDFGNNDNKRKHLTIYRIPDPSREDGDTISADKITFEYPEQKDFPPKKEEMNFDAEAFFHHNNALYIITKNRTKPFNGIATIYKVPDTPGVHEAEFIGDFITCKDYDRCRVTGADISPDNSTIALLGYGQIWLFTDFEWDDFSKGEINTIELGISTQLESISFLDNKTLLLSDEKQGKDGGNLYAFKISK